MALDRARALALLESQHAFPGPFEFRVVTRPPGKAAALGAVLAAAGGSHTLIEVSERLSEAGSYVSLRIRVQVASAEDVLAVYEVLKSVAEVITAM